MSHDEVLSLPRKFLAELDELRDTISRSRATLKLIEKKLNQLARIATSTTIEKEGDKNS